MANKKGLEPVIWTLIVMALLIVTASLYLGFIRPALSQSSSLFGKTTIGVIDGDIEDVAEQFGYDPDAPNEVTGGLIGNEITGSLAIDPGST